MFPGKKFSICTGIENKYRLYIAGGRRAYTDGTSAYAGTNGFWWSSTGSGSTAWNRDLYFGNATVNRGLPSTTYGFSVRCLRNLTGNTLLNLRFSIIKSKKCFPERSFYIKTHKIKMTVGPGGHRNNTGGSFWNVGINGFWWSSDGSGTTAIDWALNYSLTTVRRYSDNQSNGFSVRCLRNLTDKALFHFGLKIYN